MGQGHWPVTGVGGGGTGGTPIIWLNSIIKFLSASLSNRLHLRNAQLQKKGFKKDGLLI